MTRRRLCFCGDPRCLYNQGKQNTCSMPDSDFTQYDMDCSFKNGWNEAVEACAKVAFEWSIINRNENPIADKMKELRKP